MNIYIAHSSSIDFQEKLYRPIRKSDLDDRHNFVLPHEKSEELFDSKDFLKNDCDLLIAEVSESSTGLGIELGWADMYGVPIACICREGGDPSKSLSAVSQDMNYYQGQEDLIDAIEKAVKEHED